ncbi:MAG: winged helix-turn-helix domain-containing protein [Rhodospirillales bacterium]
MGRRPKNKDTNRDSAPALRVKVRVADNIIGPGKIELLESIERTGGISSAAREMGMSFRRAWHLIDTMNTAVGAPVVETEVGGKAGGGAHLTPTGHQLVTRYRTTMASIDASAAPLLDWLHDAPRQSARKAKEPKA